VRDTFRQLQANLGESKRVGCYQLAFGSSAGEGEMVLQGSSDMFFLMDQSKEKPTSQDIQKESVEIVTLDAFCQTKAIDTINFLKIDTEGGDLEVLKGAVNMLTGQKVDLVQVEAGMNPGNSRHVPLESLKSFLESHAYFIFGFYEQVHEWPTREPKLRRTNAIFASQRVIDMNRKPPRPSS
jgi:FkbM family methyltransferase